MSDRKIVLCHCFDWLVVPPSEKEKIQSKIWKYGHRLRDCLEYWHKYFGVGRSGKYMSYATMFLFLDVTPTEYLFQGSSLLHPGPPGCPDPYENHLLPKVYLFPTIYLPIPLEGRFTGWIWDWWVQVLLWAPSPIFDTKNSESSTAGPREPWLDMVWGYMG